MKNTSAPSAAPAPSEPDVAALPGAKELDAVLLVIEKRSPGLRKAGVSSVVVGAVRAELEPLGAEPEKRRDPADDDEGPDDIFDVTKYRGGRRGGQGGPRR